MTFTQLFSAGGSFNWDGDSHGKHPLKGTNGEDDPFNNIDPFGGRAKKMFKDGTFIDTKYGVDLGGRGNNSLFEDLDKNVADLAIRLHSNAPGPKTASLKTLHQIFHGLGNDYSDMTWREKRAWQKEETQEGRETFDRFHIGRDAAIKVTDGNGDLTDGFKQLLNAAFGLGKYADEKDAKDTDGFAGRVLHDGTGFVVQIAAEAYHGDDGAAEIMTFSGALATEMVEHVLKMDSERPEPKFSKAGLVIDTENKYIWYSYIDTYNDDDQIVSRTMTYDDGRIYITSYENGVRSNVLATDPDNTHVWDSQTIEFDEKGQIVSRTMNFDDGRVHTTSYVDGVKSEVVANDPGRVTTTSYVDGVISKRVADHSDGAVYKTYYEDGVRSSKVATDSDDNHVWKNYITTYNEQGQAEAQTMTYDDGRVYMTSFENGVRSEAFATDLDDQHVWDIQTIKFGQGGQVVSRKMTHDNGTVVNYIYSGEAGEDLIGTDAKDVFVFRDGFGHDVISDFDLDQAGERINLKSVTSITDFADLESNYLSQKGDDAVIDAGNGNTITLAGVDMDKLTADDFLL